MEIKVCCIWKNKPCYLSINSRILCELDFEVDGVGRLQDHFIFGRLIYQAPNGAH